MSTYPESASLQHSAGKAGLRWSGAHALLGVLSLVGCPILLIAYLLVHHDVDLLTAIRAFIALYFLGVAPGYLLQRYLFRIKPATAFETLLSSLVLGVLLTPFLWYGLCWAGLQGLFAPFVIGLGLVVPGVARWHRRPWLLLKQLVYPADAPILWLAAGLVIVWSHTISIVEIQEGRVAIKAHYDHGFHAIQTAELARGVPPQALPFFSSVQRSAYHYMPHVWCDLMRRAAGTDPDTAYFHIALPLRYLLLSFACYLALVRRFARLPALAGVLCMLAFVEPARFSFPKGWLIYLHYNYPTSFGLMVTFLILYYVAFMDRKRSHAVLLLISILSGLLLYFKSLHALAVMPAVGIFSAIILIKRRDYRWLMVCLSVQGAIATVFYLQSQSASFKPTLVLAPFAFVQWWWSRLALPPSVNDSLHQMIESCPDLLRWPVIFLGCLIQRFHLGIIILTYLVLSGRFGARRPRLLSQDMLVALILLACVAGLVLFPIQEGLVWNISIHVWALVSALVFALMGPAIVDLFQRLLASRRRAFVGIGAAAIAVGIGYNAYALRRVALWETNGSSGYVSAPFYECCRFINATAPSESVILHPRYRECYFVSLLTGRRSVLEYALNWQHFYPTAPILADLDDFYAGTDDESARTILDRYKVDYVVLDRVETPPPQDDSFLDPVFRSGEMVVYHVRRQDPGLATANKRGLPATGQETHAERYAGVLSLPQDADSP